MTRCFTFLAVFLMLLMGSAAYAQFAATVAYIGPTPLTTTCESGTPIADGYIVKIYWDTDSDGPDLEDPQPTLCDLPDCETPFGSVNFNEFPMNGTGQGVGAGYFIMETAFSSVGGLPTPARYYLRLYELDGVTPLWTTAAFTLVNGYQDVILDDEQWTCGGLGPQCIVLDETE
jgi:hypothetical protein